MKEKFGEAADVLCTVKTESAGARWADIEKTEEEETFYREGF